MTSVESMLGFFPGGSMNSLKTDLRVVKIPSAASTDRLTHK